MNPWIPGQIRMDFFVGFLRKKPRCFLAVGSFFQQPFASAAQASVFPFNLRWRPSMKSLGWMATKEDFLPLPGKSKQHTWIRGDVGRVFFLGLKNEATGKVHTQKNWNDIVILAILRWWPCWEAGVTWPFGKVVDDLQLRDTKVTAWSTWIIGFLTTRIGKSYATLDVVLTNLLLCFTSDDNIYKQVGVAILVVLGSEDPFLFDKIKPWICLRCLEKV